jgi:hypothetical protein
MKNIIGAIFSVLALFALPGAYAEQSPESIVVCGRSLFSVDSHTLPGFVNTELCTEEQTCATCIPSLEDQGCKVIKVVPKPFRGRNQIGEDLTVTYFLSCSRP